MHTGHARSAPNRSKRVIQLAQEGAHAGVDIVAYEAHPLHAFDATGGRLVGVPAFQGAGGVGWHAELGGVANYYYSVDCAQQFWVDGFWCAARHVGTEFCNCGDGFLVQRGARFRASGEDADLVACVVSRKRRRHL